MNPLEELIFLFLHVVTILGNIVTTLGDRMSIIDILFVSFGVFYTLFWPNLTTHVKDS